MLTGVVLYEQGLVILKWLALQASSNVPGNVKQVTALLDHPAFNINNPNKCATPLRTTNECGYRFFRGIVFVHHEHTCTVHLGSVHVYCMIHDVLAPYSVRTRTHK